jgi:type I restriction enzyme M protein
MEYKSKLITLFKSCLNILRDNEGLTGEKALKNMSYLLILKLIEQHIGKEIDIDNYKYIYNYEINELIENQQKLFTNVRFSNLLKDKNNIVINIKYIWEEILSQNPATKNVFLKDKMFDIQKQSTYISLIEKLNSIIFKIEDYDILGNAYEEVIQDIMTGKVLGQFFTPPIVKKIMVKLIDPEIYDDGTIDTCADPTMGTGGFLITYLHYILQKAKDKNIIPNWDFIKNNGLYGKELDPDTYQLAISNMLISSGHMFDKLDKGDSIREPILKKFNNILANPPFGIKGLKYDDFNNSLKKEYIPIKTDNAVSLFIQTIIYMLKIDGKCAIVLPDGQDLFSKSNKTLILIREYLIKTCDLKEIIYLPSGIFTYTNINTCIFYFVKKQEGSDILNTIHKKNIIYNFTSVVSSTSIKFYNYNIKTDNKELIIDVPIDKIINNKYSLNYAEYTKTNLQINKYNKDIYETQLGDICCIIKGLKKKSKTGKIEGLYPFYYCSILGNLYLDTYDYTDEGIIINKTNGSGKAMVYYGFNKYSVGETTIHFKSKDSNVLTKYLYYYLFNNINLIQQYFKGANQKSIVEEDLFKIKIPVPSLLKQTEIINYCDNNDFLIKKYEQEIDNTQKLNNLFINNTIKPIDIPIDVPIDVPNNVLDVPITKIKLKFK